MVQVKLDDVEVPSELLDGLAQSGLSSKDQAGQIRTALAIHLFLVGQVSLGKAAQLAGESKWDFQELLVKLGLPLLEYDLDDYHEDLATMEALERERKNA